MKQSHARELRNFCDVALYSFTQKRIDYAIEDGHNHGHNHNGNYTAPRHKHKQSSQSNKWNNKYSMHRDIKRRPSFSNETPETQEIEDNNADFIGSTESASSVISDHDRLLYGHVINGNVSDLNTSSDKENINVESSQD